MKKYSEEKKAFIMFSVFFGILGVIVCAALSLSFKQLKLYPLMFFLVLYPTTVIAVGGTTIIFENAIEIMQLNYINKFKKRNSDDYELYDNLIKTYEQLKNLITNFESQNIKTQDMLNELYAVQEKYNKLLLDTTQEKEKDKNFAKFCKINNLALNELNYSYTIKEEKTIKSTKEKVATKQVKNEVKQTTKPALQKESKSNKVLVKNIIESTKNKDKTL